LGNNRSLFIVGCGDLGARVGHLLQEQQWTVGGCRRNPDPAVGFEQIAADFSAPGSLDFLQRARPDFVLATFSPTSMDTQGYQRGFSEAAANLVNGLGEHRPRLLIIASSTRVYAETTGAWVDETSELSSTDERARAIVNAEQRFLLSDHNATIVRFGGLYGAPNSRLISRVARGDIAPPEPVRYTNRMHRDDCAGFIVHLLHMNLQGRELAPIYNGVDSSPAPAHEVESWLARSLGCEQLPVNAPAVARPAGHKRCSNALLRATGYELLYPDYQAGYSQLLES
jgi:nucleoside-diphosphate-sugar epimerase